MEKVKKKILVSVDGSDNSKRAILEARRHLQMFDAQISLLTVVNPAFPDYDRFLEENEKEDVRQKKPKDHPALAEALELLGKNAEEIPIFLKIGEPATEILAAAEAGDYDLILMGSRGRGNFSKAFLGSVSNKVLNHANTSVLIVK